MLRYLLTLLTLLPISVLAQQQANADDLVNRNGIAYVKEATAPFTGVAVAKTANGDVQTEIEYKAGQMDGRFRMWYRRGVKMIEGHTKAGRKTGEWNMWYENGKPKKQSHYENDLENGDETFWTQDGKIEKTGTYRNGKLNGTYVWYYDNGKPKQEGHYTNGEKDGTWKDYYEDGKPKMTGSFASQKKSGIWTWWDEFGNASTRKYDHDTEVTQKEPLDIYVDKMSEYIAKRDFKNALKNIELAIQTVQNKTVDNPLYMGLVVYHSKVYSQFFHPQQGEEVLLKAVGIPPAEIAIILKAIDGKSAEKIKGVIGAIQKREANHYVVGNHIALSLCYNILGDTIKLKKEQQLMMDKSGYRDWIPVVTVELYNIVASRMNSYHELAATDELISKNGLTPDLEIARAGYLVRNERFAEAEKIVDKYLKLDPKNVKAILLKADLEMANGNVAQMAQYEAKAKAIDPKIFENKSDKN